jgi:transcriptional regulator with XRE-family HTH domain
MAIMHERIKELRSRKGMTLASVADYLEVTEATAQRYETGKGIKTIPYEVIEKYANLFHCTPSYIMGWEGENLTEKTEKPTEDDGLSENQKALIDFARNVPEDKAVLVLRVMKSILEGDK